MRLTRQEGGSHPTQEPFPRAQGGAQSQEESKDQIQFHSETFETVPSSPAAKFCTVGLRKFCLPPWKAGNWLPSEGVDRVRTGTATHQTGTFPTRQAENIFRNRTNQQEADTKVAALWGDLVGGRLQVPCLGRWSPAPRLPQGAGTRPRGRERKTARSRINSFLP